MKRSIVKATVLLTLLLLLPITLAFDLDLKDKDLGTLEGNAGNTKRVTLDGTNEFTIKFSAVGQQRIMLTINPGEKTVILDLNQKKDITLDEEKINIEYISYTKENKAVINLRTEEAIPKSIEPIIEEETIQPPTDVTGSAVSTGISSIVKNTKFIYGIIIMVIIIIIIAFVASSGKSPENFYKKAADLEREAKEFHDDGDEETAQELNKKSIELRKKAREADFK